MPFVVVVSLNWLSIIYTLFLWEKCVLISKQWMYIKIFKRQPNVGLGLPFRVPLGLYWCWSGLIFISKKHTHCLIFKICICRYYKIIEVCTKMLITKIRLLNMHQDANNNYLWVVIIDTFFSISLFFPQWVNNKDFFIF